jgi:hypothetical protein
MIASFRGLLCNGIERANGVCGLQQHLLHAKPSEIAKFSRIFDDSSLQRV